jgi:hypothetical protein
MMVVVVVVVCRIGSARGLSRGSAAAPQCADDDSRTNNLHVSECLPVTCFAERASISTWNFEDLGALLEGERHHPRLIHYQTWVGSLLLNSLSRLDCLANQHQHMMLAMAG